MDSYALLAGNLLEWVDSIDADEKYEFSESFPDGEVGRVVHLRAGLADIMVKPKGVDHRTGMIGYEASLHTHENIADAVKCFQHNRAGNERRNREWEINPERAVARAQGEAMGIPLEVIDAIMPITGTGALDQARERLFGSRPRQHRPTEDPSPAEYALACVWSVNRSGLSQTSASMSFLNHEPSYPIRAIPRAFDHSAAAFRSVVRCSTGAASSLALLNPNDAPQG